MLPGYIGGANKSLFAGSEAANVKYDNTVSGLTATDTQGAIDELNADKANKEWILAGSVDSASQSGSSSQRITTVTVPNTATEVLLQITYGSSVIASTLGLETSDSVRVFAYRVGNNVITDYVFAQYTKSTGQLMHMWVSGTEYSGTSAKLYYK